MPLDEEQKKALREKYKEHRREVWRGQTSRFRRDEKEDPDILLTTSNQRNSESYSAKKTETSETEEETTIMDNVPLNKEIDDIEKFGSVEFGNETQAALIEKIKEQRRGTWAGNPSSKSIFKGKRDMPKIPDSKGKFGNKPDKEGIGISWKLAVAVIVGITGAIGFGVFLGYIFASYLL